MLKAVFFDLDGTLLPLDEDQFIKIYFKLLCKRLAPYGYEPEKLVDVVWQGTRKMYANDGSITNEEAFWNNFEKMYGKEKLNDKPIVDEFYLQEFKEVQKSCAPNPLAAEIVKYCRDNNLLVVLSTNPLFPKNGTLTRIGFIGLSENDFDYITTYENSSFSKPNPKYFQGLLDKFNLKGDEVILFGNNTLEDGDCSFACGIKCYMVGDFVINHNKAHGEYEHINMDEVIPTISKHLKKY